MITLQKSVDLWVEIYLPQKRTILYSSNYYLINFPATVFLLVNKRNLFIYFVNKNYTLCQANYFLPNISALGVCLNHHRALNNEFPESVLLNGLDQLVSDFWLTEFQPTGWHFPEGGWEKQLKFMEEESNWLDKIDYKAGFNNYKILREYENLCINLVFEKLSKKDETCK